ncbi:AraC family transcriptional regulator [Duganella sp. Leaf126]|uniref:AraC family transcriptional regulator n=1 Tax=Duganella sp. Leaf126 TaxID=1736266 RepID=UPI000701EA79|nr:helix-turn-helix domain-containing protein [Duganella sp. Leaf126]KQQ32771.1 AraC family transcriptional regulator [Duganella sp. Leaf126]
MTTTPLTLQDRYKGVVHPADVGRLFRLERYAAPPDLAPYIEWYWMVAWELPPGLVHVQRTLPSPCVQVVFDRGRSATFGVMTGAFEYTLRGKGAVLGARFRPGTFRGLLQRAVQTITNRQLPVSAVFGGDDAHDECSVLDAADAGDDAAMVAAASAIFRRALPATPDPRVATVAKAMALIGEHREITQVAHLAACLDLSVRAVQALFREHVGATPKWVIRRNRLLDAADRLGNDDGANIDLATLAQELGYYDQAHLTTDFEALVGKPPAHYRRDCAKE